MPNQSAVTAKCRKQPVRPDRTVREQTQPAAPRIRNIAFRKLFSAQILRNTHRQDRQYERKSHDQYRLSREPVRQMVACIKDGFTVDGSVVNADRNGADVRPGWRCRKQIYTKPNTQINPYGCGQKKRNIHVEIDDAAAEQDLRDEHAAQQHHTCE